MIRCGEIGALDRSRGNKSFSRYWNSSLLTLNIHDQGDVLGSVTIRCLAVISAVASPRNRHFQVENTAFDYDVRGTFPEPAKSRFRKRLRVAGHRFRYRIDGNVYYLLRYRHIFRWNCRTNKDTDKVALLLSMHRSVVANVYRIIIFVVEEMSTSIIAYRAKFYQ